VDCAPISSVAQDRRSEQDFKARLPEMRVLGQGDLYSLLSHDQEANAIGKRVLLVAVLQGKKVGRSEKLRIHPYHAAGHGIQDNGKKRLEHLDMPPGLQ